MHGEISAGLETIAMDEGALVEGVVGPHATILGKTLGEINFRQRFRMVVVAVHRKGHNQRDRLDSLRLQPGDTLLMMGSTKAINSLSTSEEIILLDRPRVPARSIRAKMPIAIGITIGIVTLATLNIVPIVAAVTLGVAILMLTGCMKPKDAYASVEWSILMIIFGMLALGQAMDSTGASLLIAENMIGVVQNFAPEHLQSVMMLAFVYIITSTFTEFLSNNAAIALMVPIDSRHRHDSRDRPSPTRGRRMYRRLRKFCHTNWLPNQHLRVWCRWLQILRLHKGRPAAEHHLLHRHRLRRAEVLELLKWRSHFGV